MTQKIRNIFFQNARRCTLKPENPLWKTNVVDLMSENIKEKKECYTGFAHGPRFGWWNCSWNWGARRQGTALG